MCSPSTVTLLRVSHDMALRATRLSAGREGEYIPLSCSPHPLAPMTCTQTFIVIYRRVLGRLRVKNSKILSICKNISTKCYHYFGNNFSDYINFDFWSMIWLTKPKYDYVLTFQSHSLKGESRYGPSGHPPIGGTRGGVHPPLVLSPFARAYDMCSDRHSHTQAGNGSTQSK
jgi:hypothetical protein